LIETQLQIKNDNRHKSAVYCIVNTFNGHKYIGSAISNRINVRFRNHCIHGTGSSKLKNAIDFYGLHYFHFLILEYFPGIVKKENLNKSHVNLLTLETYYLNFLQPEYNILSSAHNSFGYKHSEETLAKMKKNFSDERKSQIANLNKGQILSDDHKFLMSQAAYQKYLLNPNLRKHLSKLASKPVILFMKDKVTIHSQYSSIRNMAKVFGCCHKTINKHITQSKLFKNIGYIQLQAGCSDAVRN